MSGKEEARQPRQHCSDCGAEVRLGSAFCTSCGANLTLDGRNPGQDSSPSSGQSPSMNDVVQEKLQGIARRFRGSSFSSTTNIRSAPQNLLRWFKSLPVALKATIVVLGALVLLTVLSPLGLVVALLLFGTSIIGLIVRAGQRRSVKGWGVIAVASLVFALVFGSVSNALYGNVTLGDASSSSGDAVKGNPSSAAPAPDYYVVESKLISGGDERWFWLTIFSNSLSRENLKDIVRDLAETRNEIPNADAVSAIVVDSDDAIEAIRSPDRPTTVDPWSARKSQLGMRRGVILVNFSMRNNGGIEEGHYSVQGHCPAAKSPEDCSYTGPIK